MIDWELAACRGEHLHLFFNPRAYAVAVGICNRCPIRQACLDDQMTFERRYGIHKRRAGVYGGKTPNQRDKIEQRRRDELGGYEKTCRDCGATFIADVPERRLCSDGCVAAAVRAYRQRQRMRVA
jgi:hypothetical protein